MAIPRTRLETDDDIARAVNLHRGVQTAQVDAKHVQERTSASNAICSTAVYRPSHRPPTPILTVVDDGADAGEHLRIRTDNFVIGRSEGDLVIPHDTQMSSRHAALRLASAGESQRWVLVDLKSTNGTLVRISNSVLDDGAEFLIGRTRLRFENSQPADGKSATPRREGATLAWQSPTVDSSAPVVVVVAEGAGRRLLLQKNENWIGADPGACDLVLTSDPYVSARHARIVRDADGRWKIENSNSLNGVWLKVPQMTLKTSCRFMLGEQVFAVRIPG